MSSGSTNPLDDSEMVKFVQWVTKAAERVELATGKRPTFLVVGSVVAKRFNLTGHHEWSEKLGCYGVKYATIAGVEVWADEF